MQIWTGINYADDLTGCLSEPTGGKVLPFLLLLVGAGISGAFYGAIVMMVTWRLAMMVAITGKLLVRVLSARRSSTPPA